jgi:DNA-binding MarR family transcriptional regulator
VRLTPSGRKELDAMQRTFANALKQHFLDHLSEAQLAALIDVGSTLGAPHC